MTDQQNLILFNDVIRRAYLEAKEKGRMPFGQYEVKFDRILVDGDAHIDTHNGRIRLMPIRRIWRGRVARHYAVDQGTPLNFLLPGTIHWDDIFHWIYENIEIILRMLIIILPLVF